MTTAGYASAGAAIFAAIVWMAKWWISKSLDARFERKEREDQDYRREQIDDAIHTIRGQQVTADCLHVILLSMISGNHAEDLAVVQRELETYREENSRRLMEKAAKYNRR